MKKKVNFLPDEVKLQAVQEYLTTGIDPSWFLCTIFWVN